MDVVIEYGIAVLQILPLRDAVRGDQQVNFSDAIHLAWVMRTIGSEVGGFISYFFPYGLALGCAP